MKKNVILLLFAVPLFGFGQEIITNEDRYLNMIYEHIGFTVKNVIFPGIDSVACDSVENREGEIRILVRVNQDSLGKFHVDNIRVRGDCPKKKQYIEDKKNEIIRDIEEIGQIKIFYVEYPAHRLPKKNLFERWPYLGYGFSFFIQISECGDEFIFGNF